MAAITHTSNIKATLVDENIDRLGFKRVVLEQKWYKNPETVHNGTAGITVSDLKLIRIDISADDGGWNGTTRWTYEGLVAKTHQDAMPTELTTRMAELPIEVHPHIAELITKYEGLQGGMVRLRFPKWLKDKSKNPLFGVDSYLDVRATYTRTFSTDEIPSAMAATIEDPPGEDFKTVSTAEYNWLRMPTKARWRGTAWEVTEEWQRSGRGGWSPFLYATNEGDIGSSGKRKGLR